MPVLLGVVFAGLLAVVCRVIVMAVGDVCMMRGFFVIARLMVLGGSMVMFGCVFVVLSSFAMVFCSFFGHKLSSLRRNLHDNDTGRV